MRAAVIGSGSWGTALAQLLATSGHDAVLRCRDAEVAESVNGRHRNPRYLTDVALSERVAATTSYGEALDGADACVLVTPSAYLRHTVCEAASFISSDLPIVICSKGTEAETGKLASEVVADEAGNPARIAVLSGPTHAEEVVRGMPSGAVCASADAACAAFFRDLFAARTFRTYVSADIVGVELCAAFKNVIAIAVGISYGAGNGDNTAAMLITRGLAEMSRMVVACGGEALTCMGLAGAGDMVVTCTSKHSRNRRFGEFYAAHGKTLEDFRRDTHMVVEGALACKTLDVLACRHGVDLPLTNAVRRIVWEGADLQAESRALFDRPLTEEFYGLS